MAKKLVSRTHFKRSHSEKEDAWLWYWATEAPNAVKVGVGGEGYDELAGSLNGFMSQQGYPAWKSSHALPEGYVLEKFADDHYVITRFEEKEENNGV